MAGLLPVALTICLLLSTTPRTSHGEVLSSPLPAATTTAKDKTRKKRSKSRGKTGQRAASGFDEEEMARELEELREKAKEKERYDRPGEAAEFHRTKRAPEGAREVPVERYLKALEEMRELPQYSTLQGKTLPSRDEASFGQATPQTQTLASWKSLGPGNTGGRTRTLLISPSQPDVLYAGAASGGVWKSTDAGKAWRPLADLMPNLAVNALAMDPQNPDVIYAGTGEGYFNSDSIRGAGIFKSFDGGNTWRRLDGTGTADFYYVNDIVVSPTKSNRLYAATRSGVMRSLDGGDSWTLVHQADRVNGGCLDLAIRTDKTGDYVIASCGTAIGLANAAAVQAAIYRNMSAETGLGAWELVHTEPGMGRTSIAIAPSNQDVIYAVSSESGATGTPHSVKAVYRSTAGGAPDTWQARMRAADAGKLNATLFSNPIYAFFSECQRGTSQYFNQGWYNNTIAVDPKDENSVWVGGVDLFRSDDGGATFGMGSFWHLPQSNTHYVHADQHAILFHPQYDGLANRRMYVGTDGGIFRTENARGQVAAGNRAPCSPEVSQIAWVSLNAGYEVTQFYHGVPFPDGAKYIGGTQDNGVLVGSDDAGPNGWREVLSGDGGYVAVTGPNVIYAETTGLSLRKSIDGGARWTAATTGISNSGFNFITPFVVDPSDPSRLWIGGRQMWRTRNGAQNWSQASSDLQGTTTAIAVAPADPNFVLAGTSTGQIHRTTTGMSSDADTSWPFHRPRSGYVSWIAFDPSNRDIAYATYSNFGGKHVWRTSDAGLSWQAIDGSGPGALPDLPVNCILVDPTNPQRLYLGTDLGVFVSPDGGATWAVENNGFANVMVESISFVSTGGTTWLYAFTHGRGVWRVSLGGSCGFTLSTAGQTVGVEGGQASVDVVATQNDCPWSVEEDVSWISLNTSLTQRGSGTVSFTVAPSTESRPRSATITIAGMSYTITQAGIAVSVSAASLRGLALAPESIVSAFGAGLAASIQLPPGNELPTALANVVVAVKDSAGVERRSPLFFVSPNQINYQMPLGTANGPASVMITNGADGLFNGVVNISRVAPGLFTANASGQGVAVGNVLRVKADGAQSYEPLAEWNATQNKFTARAIDFGDPTDQLFLILYGTGFRYCASPATATARLGGVETPLLFAGPQGAFAGLDQVNLQIPRALAGSGEIDVVISIDGQAANTIRINIK
ncbi:MAG: BACON domain-containing carbohydrate-binding protein [Blastocatellia bacterium]|nr:BACON domain-containing carbohydrate-binding protein [Blastocatellia bacterium]